MINATHIVPEIDMAYSEPDFRDALENVQREFGIEIVLVKAVGPGGGWPIVSLRGSYEALERALAVGWAFEGEAAPAVGGEQWQEEWIKPVVC